MNQFYNLIRSFLILATLLIVKQGVAQNILYLEQFPNTFNTGYVALPGGYSADIAESLGNWHVSGNTSKVNIAVDTPGFQTNYSVKFIDSLNNSGVQAFSQIVSPAGATDLSGQAGNNNVFVNFVINTDTLDATSTTTHLKVEFYNGSTFTTAFDQTTQQIVSTYGNTGWHQITLNVPLAYLTAGFQLFITDYTDNGSTTQQTLLLDQIVISDGAFDILPVDIISFTGNYNNYTANLNWTVDESDIRTYTIERSSDGKNFQSLSSLAALNNGSRTNYTYSDNLKGYSGLNVFYRLNILENTGYQHYSKIISLKTALINGVSLSPNPARSYTNLSFNANNNQTALIEVFDANGKAKINQRVSLFRGANTVQLDKLDQLPAGVYMIRTTVDGKLVSSKIVVQ